MKKICSILLCVGMIISLSSCGEETVLKSEYDELQAQYDELSENYSTLENDFSLMYDEYNDIIDQYNALSEAYNTLLSLNEEETTLTSSDNSNDSENGNSYTKEDFRTDITYDNLIRNPDDYMYEHFVMTGDIVQVISEDELCEYRIAIDGDYDNVIYVLLSYDDLSERLLEGDNVTFYAMSLGLISYESTLGETITIPSASVYIIERN